MFFHRQFVAYEGQTSLSKVYFAYIYHPINKSRESKTAKVRLISKKNCVCKQKEATQMGLEPTTFWSEVRRAIHCATEPYADNRPGLVAQEASSFWKTRNQPAWRN